MTRSTPDQKKATELDFNLLFDGSHDSKSSFMNDLYSFSLISLTSLIFIVVSLMFIDFL